MKHLATILLVLLAALSASTARADIIVKTGTTQTTCNTAAQVNELLSALSTRQTASITTVGTTTIDGTINITSGMVTIVIGPAKKSTIPTVTSYLSLTETSAATRLFNITGGTVVFAETSATLAGGFRDEIFIGGTARVTFSGTKNYYEFPVKVHGGTVTIDAGNFGLYRKSTTVEEIPTDELSDERYALMVDAGTVTINGGRFVTAGQHSSISAFPGTLVLKDGYELQDTETGTPADWQADGSFYLYHSSAPAKDLTLRPETYVAELIDGTTVTKYRDFDEAFTIASHSENQVRIGLLRDVVLPFGESCDSEDADFNFVIEGRGHSISAADDFEDGNPLFDIYGGHATFAPEGTGTLTLVNPRGRGIMAYGNVTLGDVVITANDEALCVGEGADVTVNGGHYVNASTAAHSAVYRGVGTLRTTSGFALGDTDTQKALRSVEGNYVKADGSAAHDISLVQVDPVVFMQVDTNPSTLYGDLASAIADANTHGDTPVNLTLIKDVTVSETLDVTGDVSLNLGSHTVTFDPSFEGVGFDLKSGASLLVTANDDGGVRSMGEKTGVLFETREGSKRLAFHGGCYESYGLVVDGNNVGDLEIRDGYFHSVAGPAVLIGPNGQNVTGGRFVTGRVDEDGMPYYAVVASSRTSVAPGYAFVAPSLDGEGEVELVAHNGSLEYWGTNGFASVVTVKPVGPCASVSIGGTSTDYNDIFAAFDAAQEAESATVTLKRDVLISEQCIGLTKGNITLNMGEYTMASERHGFVFQAGGSVQLTINRTGMTDRGYPNQVYNFIQQTNGTLTINGGYFDGTNCALQVVNGSKAVINGGIFVGGNNAVTVYGAQCVINGGRFTAQTPGNAAIYTDTKSLVTGGALSALVDAATRKPIVLAADEEDVREGSLYSLDAEGHPVADVTTTPATPAFDVTIGGVVSQYADLSTAFIINAPTTVTAARALTDATIGRTINVASDFTLDLGSHTVTLADGIGALFLVEKDASLTVNANADGGLKALHSKAQVLIHSNDEGANRIAIHGGRYECTGVVVNAWSAKELEITDGYFHSLSSTAAYFSVDSKKVTGGRFVTPNYAIITSRGSISAEYGYFDGDGRELCEHSGPLQDWGTSEYAHDVTIRRVGPRASVTIGGTTTGYGSIFDAFAAAQQAESATVTLKRDILISEKTLELTQGNITLNMGEYYITAERTGHALKVDGTASLTINRTGLTDRGYPHQGGAEYLYNTSTGTLTVNGGYFGGGFYSGAGTNLVINGGVFEGYDYALWTYKAKSTLRGGRFISHDGKNSAISLEGEEHGCDLDGSHFYASATNEELTIQAAPDKWGYPSHAPCDAKGNRVSDFYIATAPASVTTLTHVIDDALHGKATLDDIRRAVDAVLLK